MSDKDELIALLVRAGISPATIRAMLRIDALLQGWRRRATRRELGQQALVALGLDIDLAQLDVLVAIEAPSNEFGEDAGETMVQTVAERLAIDPSRASRLVAEMVEAGYAERIASQTDARRTLVRLTPAGRAIVAAVRSYKFLLMGAFLDDWKATELKAFVPLLERFSEWTDTAANRTEAFPDEIVALATRVSRERRKLAKKAG